MKCPQIAETHDVVKFVESFIIVVGEVVSCRECVTGVDAHTYAALVVDAVDYVAQMFKPVSDVAALSGSVFNHGCHTRCLAKRDID